MKHSPNVSTDLQKLATDLFTAGSAEPIEVLPIKASDETESIEVTFFQRYFRRKKLTEPTGKYYQSLKTKKVKKPLESSWDADLGIHTILEEIDEPVLDDNGKKTFKIKAGIETVEIDRFPFGLSPVKVIVFYNPANGRDELNTVIGKAVTKFKEVIAVCNLKGINKAQPVYVALPLAEGLTISNYQLYGSNNKAAGLQGKNLYNDGSERDFALTTLGQFKTVIERMQGNTMQVAKDWKDITIAFPDLKTLKRSK